MSITFLDHPQNSPEWLEARRGRFTASEFGKFVLRKDKKAIDAFENNILTKLGEAIDGDDCPPEHNNYLMERGKKLEASALAAYERHTGSEVERVGLAIHDTLPLGFSADAMVNQREHGLELKCPCAKVQILRLKQQTLPNEYLCQVHGSMFLAEVPYWDFFTFHPKLPAFYLRVYRCSFTEELGRGIIQFGEELAERKRELEAMME